MAKADVNHVARAHAAMAQLVEAVANLRHVYDECPDLNGHQPASMAEVIPCSLDEWEAQLRACLEDWSDWRELAWREFDDARKRAWALAEDEAK